jgi:2-polyprenyl-3-methyl-5-hydroxy-6-metoxy-1,4-benzoquinol methylase
MFNQKYDIAKIMLTIKETSSHSGFDYLNAESEYDQDYYIFELTKKEPDLHNYRQVVKERLFIGNKIPPFLRFNKLIKFFLTIATKTIYKAAFVITREQIIVNQHLLLSIDRLTESIHLLKSARKSDLLIMEALTSKIKNLEKKIDALEKRSNVDDIYAFGELPYITFTEMHSSDSEKNNEKFQVYLNYFAEHHFSLQNANVIDLECSKGDWLQFLNIHGANSAGITSDDDMYQHCLENNLTVTKNNIVAYLKTKNNDSVDLISGFHIIECLDMNTLFQIIAESIRILKPGGLILLEIPNSQNAITGLYNLYLNPTRIKPIHFEWMKYLLETKGFSDVSDVFSQSIFTREIQQIDKAIVESNIDSDVVRLLRKTNTIINSPENIGVVARKTQ